jgi:ribulose-5-phosphate 4-epimerase/fuculose-1-phosphate aldolase
MNTKTIIENATRLACYGDNTKFVVRGANGLVTVAQSANLKALNESDIVSLDLNSELALLVLPVFNLRPDAGAVVVAEPKYLLGLANQSVTIPPILDDFAQIVGPTLRTAKNAQSVSKAIKKRNGCMVNGIGVIVLGRTLDEAATALLVAEKTAKTYVLAKPLGGAKPIPMWEAKLMNYIYTKKYSKKDQDIKMSD